MNRPLRGFAPSRDSFSRHSPDPYRLSPSPHKESTALLLLTIQQLNEWAREGAKEVTE